MSTIYFLNGMHLTDIKVQNLCDLINEAYREGEKGLWQVSYQRITINELLHIIGKNELIVASINGNFVGAVKVKIRDDKYTGEFGMLCVNKEYRNAGLGGKLIDRVEEWALENHLTQLRLEILSPIVWQHPVKEFLKKWYQKKGYALHRSELFKASYPGLASQLITQCDFTVWIKKLR